MRLPASSELPTPSDPAGTFRPCLAQPEGLEREPLPLKVGLLAPERSVLELGALGQAYPCVSINDSVTRLTPRCPI